MNMGLALQQNTHRSQDYNPEQQKKDFINVALTALSLPKGWEARIAELARRAEEEKRRQEEKDRKDQEVTRAVGGDKDLDNLRQEKGHRGESTNSFEQKKLEMQHQIAQRVIDGNAGQKEKDQAKRFAHLLPEKDQNKLN